MTDINVAGLKPSDVALLKTIADEAADRAVKKTLVAMGLNPDDPIKAQADMAFLRSTRERCDGAVGKAMLTVIGLLVVGALSAFWIGLQAMVSRPHP